MKPILRILTICAVTSFAAVMADDVAARRDAQDEIARLEPSALLREATVRATRMDEPWSMLAAITRAAQWLEKAEALDVLGGVANALEERGREPGARGSSWATLAMVAAPLDTGARDRYLRRAVEEADAALADAELWKAHRPPPPAVPRQPPEKLAADERQLLLFHRELWLALLQEGPEGEREARLVDLLRRAEKAGGFGLESRPFRDMIVWQWGQLDPQTLLSVAPREVPASELVRFATWLAADITRHYGYHAWGKALIEWAAGRSELGERERELLREYELRARWDDAWTLGSGEARAARLEAVIRDRASDDGPSSGGDVAYRWASEVGDAGLRERLRRAAEATAYVSDRTRGVELARADEERQRLRDERRAKYDPEVIRILEKPEDLSWLKDGRQTRVEWLGQATALAWRESENWAAVQRILDAMATQEERDRVLYELARNGHPPAAEALRHIVSDRHWAAAAVNAAGAVASRRRNGA